MKSSIFRAFFTVTLILSCVLSSDLAGETQKSAVQVTIDDGLSQSTVSDILQADDGRMWFATGDGLSIYDGVNFEYVYRQPDQAIGLANNYTSSLAQDAAGRIWVGTLGGGIAVFDQDATPLAQGRAADGTIPSDEVFGLAATSDGSVWVATGGGVSLLRLEGQQVVAAAAPLLPDQSLRSLAVAHDGRVYLGSDGGGLYRFDPATDAMDHWNAENSALTGTVVLDVMEDSSDGIWIATEDDGAFRLDPMTGTITTPVTLPDPDVESVAQGQDGRMWFGTWSEGIFVYDPATGAIENYLSRPGVRQRLSSNTIVALTPGRLGRMWIGTYDNGVSSVSQTGDLFETYFPLGTGNATPGASVIWALAGGADDVLWVGSMGGLLQLDRRTKTLTQVDMGLPGSVDVRAILAEDDGLIVAVRGTGLMQRTGDGPWRTVTDPDGRPVVADAFIRLLLRATDGTLWVGTHDGVFHLAADFSQIAHYDVDTGLPHNRTRSLTEGPDGTIWIGTSGGLSRWEPETGALSLFADRDLLPDTDVRAVWQGTPSAPIYVGTQAGLAIIDPQTRKTRTFARADGLPNETIYKIIPDGQGNLWITTNNGLARLDLSRNTVQVFRASDGLQGAEFNFNAGTALPDGFIAVGGINGFSLFNPAAMMADRVPPLVTARWSPTPVDDLTAPIGLNIDLRVVQYDKPADNVLRWRLDPVDPDWRESTGVVHSLRYEKLPAGRYSLQYQGFSASLQSSPLMVTTFRIVPPLSRTWWACLGYVLVMTGLFLALLRLRTRRVLARNSELEQAVAAKTAELAAQNSVLADAARARAAFYARTAHEIRTPLSMIRAPLAHALKVPNLPKEAARLISLVAQAAARMTELTSSMDKAAAAPSGLGIGQTTVTLIAFVQPVVAYYRDMAAERGLTWTVDVNVAGAVTLDNTAFDALLHNLLSNAVRHTPAGGEVEVDIKSTDAAIQISVINDGALPDRSAQILQNFATADGPELAAQGIAIIGQSVRRLGGEVTVASEARTRILVTLPIDRISPARVADTPEVLADNDIASEGAVILIVEDDADLRRFLQEMLSPLGPVRAVASLAAARRALDRSPVRLILCDAMLPDGLAFEFAERVKVDPETAHVTVIFLTALQDETSYQAGEKAWADDYIVKPFDPNHLLKRVQLRLRAAERMRTHAAPTGGDQPTVETGSLAPFDQRLMMRFQSYLDSTFASPDAAIGDAAAACGVSERMLQRKLDSLYGKSFTELLADRRMEHAAVLLRQQDLTVSDVAAACGYRNISSFSRKFKSHHGSTPRSFARQD